MTSTTTSHPGTVVSAQGVAGQPDCWTRAAELAVQHRELLPRRGERVAVVGSGASYPMARAYAALREADGHGETDAFSASAFLYGREYDRIVAITRTGTAPVMLRLLGKVHGSVPSVAITASHDAPGIADHTLRLGFAAEPQAAVATRFPTTVLALLRAHLGENLDDATDDAYEAMEEVLPQVLYGARRFTFLGTGWTYAIAEAAAQLMRDNAGTWAQAYPEPEFHLHAPAEDQVTWVFGDVPDRLTHAVRESGGTLVTSSRDPLAELVRVQRLVMATLARGAA
ncbi:SIS domain-containing protein [Streptomyces sp. VRA16 Mangrove soil]|uniref:SIS domain-containing protein n=1 Tax=Streptomyces sp. VRA16 Mangrove soil TaxID=2817434 RepID=UPI001A9CD018|nr:sugar isomerase [Streptomyces sp. VRA16 Mangrove soil]MBO1330950.1 sugar isomerase [Streptomyces sp. VRA16 Mangrove soil]